MRRASPGVSCFLNHTSRLFGYETGITIRFLWGYFCHSALLLLVSGVLRYRRASQTPRCGLVCRLPGADARINTAN